jgi:hypothetical protein
MTLNEKKERQENINWVTSNQAAFCLFMVFHVS